MLYQNLRAIRAIRELTLDDIDLPGRRITLAGHRQRLGELTASGSLAYPGRCWMAHVFPFHRSAGADGDPCGAPPAPATPKPERDDSR